MHRYALSNILKKAFCKTALFIDLPAKRPHTHMHMCVVLANDDVVRVNKNAQYCGPLSKKKNR